MKSRKRVTMKDVAVKAGVTASSVSLVFRGKPGISVATRDRILRTAGQLGYRADPYVSTLMTNRRKGKLPSSSPVLAFASAYPTPEGWRNHSPTFVSYFEGARTRAAEKGYRLENFWLGKNGAKSRRACTIFYARNISGVLLAPLPDNMRSLDLEWDRIHAVALGFSLARPALNRAVCDHLQSMMIALSQCHRLGYRRMGLVLSRGNHARVDGRWLAALLMEQERMPGLDRVEPLLVDEWRDRAFIDWLDRERPDVVLGHSGESLLQLLRQCGRRVPEDIGVVDMNRRDPGEEISGIFENPARIGARAVDLLIGTMGRNERGIPKHPSTLLIDGAWIDGNTLKKAEGPVQRRFKAQAEPKVCRLGHVSMRDVAAKAKVHPATVSLSLRNHPRIPEKTQRRVQAAAEELGYRKNPYISELMKNKRIGRLPRRKPILGFVTAFPTPDGWKRESALFEQYFIGARRRAKALGFRLKEFWLSDPSAGFDLSDTVRREGVQGLMFAPLPVAGMRLSWRWEHFCSVGFGFTLSEPRIHRVANDTYSSMRRTIRECYRLGYRRIGFALSANSNSRVQNRWVAAFLMQRQQNSDGLIPRFFLAEEWIEHTVRKWVDKEKPDVILAPSPDQLKKWLPDWGYSVPDDIGLVSLNCIKKRRWLSGIDQNGELLGTRATNVLVGLIERDEYGIPNQPNTLLVDGTWNSGRSLRPVSVSAEADESRALTIP